MDLASLKTPFLLSTKEEQLNRVKGVRSKRWLKKKETKEESVPSVVEGKMKPVRLSLD